MRHSTPSAVEIDRKLRDDFRRRVRDFGISAELTDPVMAVLFRTFAQQLEQLYSETDRIRFALLEEFISNLGMSPRMPSPAQTLVRFSLDRGSQMIPAGTQLVGEAQSGERLTFMTDATLAVSEANIAFALGYQDGGLRLLSSVEIGESIQALRPSLDVARVNLGPNPALFLAVENLPGDHLSQHTLFFDLGPDAFLIEEALKTQTWCLMNDSGELSALGILQPTAANAGLRTLHWLVPGNNLQSAATDEPNEIAELPPGFYGPRNFVFPPFPADRRFLCKVPRAMENSLAKIFGREAQKALSADRAWIRISMPGGIPALNDVVVGITLHAMTASNVECFNQTVVFERQGTSIPIEREQGGVAIHLVAPLSVFGESGKPYIPESEVSIEPGVGRYTIRNGRIDLIPGRRNDGRLDTYANLRMWITHGSLGNKVDPGRVTGFLKASPIAGLRLTNPTAASGGTDSEELSKAQNRFAETLLGRDRIVTKADLMNSVRSFDNRIASIEVQPGVKRCAQGLIPVERIGIGLKREDFIDPDVEFPRLQAGLRKHLADRLPLGTEIAVEVSAQ